jgi:hypothetical protein
MSKITQYIINDIKLCDGFLEVNLKEAQLSLQNITTWIQNFGRGVKSGKNLVLLQDCPSRC